MRRAVVSAIVLSFLIAAAPARAEGRWSIEARSGWTVMGGERSTGGLTLGGAGRYSSGDGLGWHVGLGADAIGVGDSWHWLGIVVGPEVGISYRGESFHVGVTAVAPAGQLPTCNAWGLCLRYWGIYPGGSVRLQYAPSDGFAVGADAGALYVNTLGWAGAAVQLRAVGALSF